jgi:hypothetical protein
MDDVVHQLYELTNNGARATALGKCGVTAEYPRGDGLPGTMTGWSSRTTCPECLGQSFEDSLERWYAVLGKAAVWHAIRSTVSKALAATL